MKVLHLIGGGDIGGAKSHVLSLVKELGKHIKVKIVSLRPGPFTDDGRAMGINIEVVRTGSIIRDINEVIRITKAEGYEILHSHGAKANMIAAIVKRFTGIHTVTTIHSDYRLDYLQSVSKRLSFGLINTMSIRFLDYYIGVSKNYKEMLVERKFDPERIFTVYNGIDFNSETNTYSRSQFSQKYGIPICDKDIVIGIAARLDPVKGVGIFIRAAAEVLKNTPSIKFLIFGDDGGERKFLERKVKDLGVQNSVFFMGHVTDLDQCLGMLDVNVLSSLSESFPYAILEGARHRRATISSEVGGISDLISNGETGYLFRPGDYMKLAEHLQRLVSNEDLRKKLGEGIYQKASMLFSLNSMCNTQLGIYSRILELESLHSKPFIYLGLQKRFDVIISGYYGFENSGDDAILDAVINNLKQYKNDIKILVLSKKPQETKDIYSVDSVNRFNLFDIIWAMKNAKLFINGGGTLIQDNTSTRSLMYYLGTIWLAKKLGLKVMIYANGIGPINKRMNKKITQRIVSRVDVITLREELSKIELDNLHINKDRVIVTADPALTIQPIGDEEINQIFSSEGISLDGHFVGFSIREWKGYEKNYSSMIAAVADMMIDKYGVKPVFIPMHYPGDVPISEDIVAKMKGKGYVTRKKYGVPQMFGIIKKMEIMVGMRLHSLIYAASLGIPAVGLVYDPKVEGFLQYFNQTSAGHVESLDYDCLEKAVEDVWSRKSLIKKQLEGITDELKQKALENAKIAVELMES